MTHIYDWLNDFKPRNPTEEALYKFLDFRTRPADFQWENRHEIEGLSVYCKYQGKKYKITGASRMGDVWLHENLEADKGYTKRVAIDDCREFSFKNTGDVK